MKRSWKKLRYRLEYAGLTMAAKLIVLLPHSAVIFLARFFGAAAFVIDRRGRRVGMANLECAFGNTYSASKRRRILRRSYQQFAQTMLELIWSPRLNPRNFHRYFELSSVEHFKRAHGTDPNVIIACYHYSNFEWFGLGTGFVDLPAMVIAQEFKNKLLDPIFQRWREASGHRFTARTGGILRLYRTLRRKGAVALLVDLTIPPGASAVAINCFGLRTSVTSAHAWLHQQSAAPIVPGFCEPMGRGRYRLIFQPAIAIKPNATLREIAQACWDSFEPVIRQRPGQWLWIYKHWRYRPMQPERPYPFYASEHPRFEQMLAEQ